jgi:polyisoprenyl-phosphate glycosyltransferase
MIHTMSVVIPVYAGERTLESVVAELETFTAESVTTRGHRYVVEQVLLVHDHGPDRSDSTIRALAERYPWVRPVWLSRNYGQHAATLAGVGASSGAWIVTMDEDGQHDPNAIGAMLDLALSEQRQVVYAKPTNPSPHGPARNAASKTAKFVVGRLLTGGQLSQFHSFRLVHGEVGRGMAAFCGPGVYLDVALNWVATSPGHCPVAMRDEGDRPSGYSWRSLLSHFWQLVISSGTRPLRLVSVVGVLMSISGFVLAGYAISRRLVNEVDVEGWTSVFVAVLIIGGFLMLAIGIVAEYVAVAVRMAMGKPLYLAVSDPKSGVLGDEPSTPGPAEQA